MQAIGRVVGTGIPANIIAVYRPGELALLAGSALVIAAAGALGPATRAAAARPKTIATHRRSRASGNGDAIAEVLP